LGPLQVFCSCKGAARELSYGMDETTIELREAEAHFEKITPLIRAGQTITLCEANQPLAEIRPLPRRIKTRRPFGLARGTFTVPADFSEPDAEIERMFFGSGQ
jgi:antitoxin (DNA-binding transcriptional repressor) of toxin-antitoxin stability system